MSKINVIAEAGINHNGDITLAKQLIRVAAVAGCDYVKFQKRTPDLAVPKEKKAQLKTVPWHEEPITYLQYKYETEFSVKDYRHLRDYADQQGIELFASVWDRNSAEEMAPLMRVVKIPSAKITDMDLLQTCRKLYPYRIMSTGMSTEEEIRDAVKVFDPDVVMHTNSVYPTPVNELKFGYLKWLQKVYGDFCQIGYSNHYYGTKAIYVAMGIGVQWLEFHLTLDHTMWGSDQSSSVEPHGAFEIMKAVRDFEYVIGDGYGPRTPFPGEEIKREALR